jgi:hypothetical protein
MYLDPKSLYTACTNDERFMNICRSESFWNQYLTENFNLNKEKEIDDKTLNKYLSLMNTVYDLKLDQPTKINSYKYINDNIIKNPLFKISDKITTEIISLVFQYKSYGLLDIMFTFGLSPLVKDRRQSYVFIDSASVQILVIILQRMFSLINTLTEEDPYRKIIDILIKNKIRSDYGLSLLMLSYSSPGLIMYLIENGYNIDTDGKTPNGLTLLHLVAANSFPDNEESVKIVLDLGADPNAILYLPDYLCYHHDEDFRVKNSEDECLLTPLGLALRNPKAVEMLIKAGATINPNDIFFRHLSFYYNKMPTENSIEEILYSLFNIKPYQIVVKRILKYNESIPQESLKLLKEYLGWK